MFKKLIATVSLLGALVSSLSALEVDIEIFHGLGHQINMEFDTTDHLGENRDNWVGVYKKGVSNDWNNVVKWAWLKDLRQEMTPADFNDKKRVLSAAGLEAGIYDIRIFLNNSFETFDSLEITMAGDEGAATIRISEYQNFENKIEVSINVESLADDTWIGIYKKGASHVWGNVLDWSWCPSHGPGSETISFDTSYLKNGVYEARLFYDNSYHIEDKVEFTIEGNNEEASLKVNDINYVLDNSFVHIESSYDVPEVGSTWIGIYNIGAENEWGNVLAWKWVTKAETIINLQNLNLGSYEARLFYNNSYEVEASTIFQIEEAEPNKIFQDQLINTRDTLIHVKFANMYDFNDKDWVAIFKKGEQKVSENVLSWTYIYDDEANYLRVIDLPDGEYELVYFLRDTYEQSGRSGKITIDRE